MKRFFTTVAALIVLAAGLSTAQAVTYYYDRDDNNPGALPADAMPGDGKGDGFWDTTALNWNTNADGYPSLRSVASRQRTADVRLRLACPEQSRRIDFSRDLPLRFFEQPAIRVFSNLLLRSIAIDDSPA